MRPLHILVPLSVLFISCFIAPPRLQAEEGSFRLGILFCLSGDCAAQGLDALRGAQLAAQELNEHGGVLGRKIELVVEDTKEGVSGAQAVSAYRQIRLNQDLTYLLGPIWTPAALALAPIVSKEQEILMVSPATGTPEFHRAGENLFNTRGTDEAASRREARYALAKGFKRVAIFSSQQPWETAQADYFEDELRKQGGVVVIRVEPLATVTDISAEAMQISRHKPDAVYISSMVLMGRAARKLRELNYSGPFIGSFIDEPRIADAQGALQGAVFFSFEKPSDEFRQKFLKRFGEIPLSSSAVSYDTVWLLARTIEQTKTFDTFEVRKALVVSKSSGASGAFSFDAEGGAIRDLVQFRVRGADYEAD